VTPDTGQDPAGPDPSFSEQQQKQAEQGLAPQQENVDPEAEESVTEQVAPEGEAEGEK